MRPLQAQALTSESITLSVIVPVCNESEVIEQLHQRLTKVLRSLSISSEIIYIDDGSTDNSWIKLQALPECCSEQTLVSMSRNFGKEAAMSAGLDAAKGDVVIIIDADLQDPPELIPQMLEQWREGFDIVNMRRRQRLGESWLRIKTASLYYRILNLLADIKIPENVGDFRLLSRRVVDSINTLPEKSRYMKGLFAWPGFQTTEILFDRAARHAGATKWNYWKLFGLALDGITSFSVRPLRLATLFGTITSLFALLFILAIAVNSLIFGEAISSHSSLMVVILLLAGIQLMGIGLLGEYVGRIFIESKQRPLYQVMKQITKPSLSPVKKLSRQ